MTRPILSLKERILRGAAHVAQRLTWEQMREVGTCFWDIEASGLNADFGIALCISIKGIDENEVWTVRLDDAPNYNDDAAVRCNDGWVAEATRDKLEEYTVVVHHYGDRFDLPFLNTRLLGHRRRLLDTSTRVFVDTWWHARHRLRLHSNRLDSLIHYLDTKTQKTGLDGNIWTSAVTGVRSSMDWVVEHNINDVLALEEVTKTLASFAALKYSNIK